MSKQEKDRLINDVMGKPLMMAEAMMIKDQAGMEAFITKKGYDLTKDEMTEVWQMANQAMSGGAKTSI